VLTPLVQQQIDKRIAEGSDPQQAREQLLAEKQPSGEFVTPEQLGELALFLCSEGAARCAARHGTWTAAGSRNNRQPAQEAPVPSEQAPHFSGGYFLSVYFRQKTMSSGYLFNNDVWFQAIKSGRKSYVRSKRCQKPP
jgi:hypothetical protein